MSANQVRQVKCRSCQAPIVWMKTAKQKNIPVDVEGIDEEELDWEGNQPLFDPEEHTAHFATCPDADKHRRSR